MAFYNWAISNGYQSNLTIDRIDNNKGYEPSNCRWATPTEQVRNRSNTLYITYQGETKTLVEWCNIYNISYKKVWQRVNRGWSIEEALELCGSK